LLVRSCRNAFSYIIHADFSETGLTDALLNAKARMVWEDRVDVEGAEWSLERAMKGKYIVQAGDAATAQIGILLQWADMPNLADAALMSVSLTEVR
jgi:hypothetical protein